MAKPQLYVIAGCNGSGKSSFSKFLLPPHIPPYDFDKVYMERYKTINPSDIWDEKATYNYAVNDFNSNIKHSLKNNLPFCYETNFNFDPLKWPKVFKEKGYELILIYLCLDSIEKAKKRVLIRYENGGHFVSNSDVEERYIAGFENLNKDWSYFDTIMFFETSTYGAVHPKHILTMHDEIIVVDKDYPEYLKKLLPSINLRLR